MTERNPPGEGRIFIGMGSNVGNRIAYLRRAVEELRGESSLKVIAASPVYKSAAHTLEPSHRHPDFLNAVVEIATDLDPHDLLNVCLRIERSAGRTRDEDVSWAPRTLDLDLLIFGQAVIDDKQLAVPHRRLGQRQFVLRPLADLAPELYVPAPYETTVAALLRECPDTDVPVRTEYVL